VKVAIDVSSLAFGVDVGIALYFRRLIESLIAEDDSLELRLLYQQQRTPEADAALDALRGPRVEVRFAGAGHPRLPRRSPHWAPWQASVRSLVGDVDVFHSGDGGFPRGRSIPIVATVFDLTPRLFPEYHTLLNRLYYSRRFRWLAGHADRIMAISEATKRDFCRFYDFSPDRIDVTLLARAHALPSVDSSRQLAALRARHGLGDAPYVLSVGTLEPRKNHLRLIRAFERVAETHADTHLVLAGKHGWMWEPISRALDDSRFRDRVHVLGAVSEQDLVALYAGASVFAYPSLYEGFGLPVLEAMAAGTPVLTSNVSSLPEVAGDAAVLVDPHDEESIAQALGRLLGDSGLRNDLARRGRERERDFTWARVARATLEVYRGAASAHGIHTSRHVADRR
jgi:glycosyltransferase involved in cell wall biosynthesis